MNKEKASKLTSHLEKVGKYQTPVFQPRCLKRRRDVGFIVDSSFVLAAVCCVDAETAVGKTQRL